MAYYRSIENGCGSWCLSHKGLCGSSYSSPNEQLGVQEELRPKKSLKSLAKGAIIGAALGVSCLLAHIACLTATFYHHHAYLKPAIALIYTAMTNNSDNEKETIERKVLSGALEISVTGGVDQASSRLGNAFSSIAGGHSNVSRVWANEIGKETSREMLSQGTSGAFDWCSKALLG